MNKLIIFGLLAIAISIILIWFFLVLTSDFKKVVIPPTSEGMSKVEACLLIGGDWDTLHKTCDDIYENFCEEWLEGTYIICKPPEYQCPLDQPNCTSSEYQCTTNQPNCKDPNTCFSSCIFENSIASSSP